MKHIGTLIKTFERILDDFNHGICGNRTVEDHEKDIETIRTILRLSEAVEAGE